MQTIKAVTFGLLIILVAFLAAPELYAQAFGEYGRIMGGVGQRQGSMNGKSLGVSSSNIGGKKVVEGIGDVGGSPVPSALVVTSREAALYPRQDDEAEKIAQLPQGETVIPMGQSNGGNDWYMVKTQKGLVGWIKSGDVRAEAAKK